MRSYYKWYCNHKVLIVILCQYHNVVQIYTGYIDDLNLLIFFLLVTTLFFFNIHYLCIRQGSNHGTVVTHWTAGQHVERLILHLGHDSYKNSSHQPMVSPAQYSLAVQNCDLKHPSFLVLIIYNLELITYKDTDFNK